MSDVQRTCRSDASLASLVDTRNAAPVSSCETEAAYRFRWTSPGRLFPQPARRVREGSNPPHVARPGDARTTLDGAQVANLPSCVPGGPTRHNRAHSVLRLRQVVTVGPFQHGQRHTEATGDGDRRHTGGEEH